MASERAIGATPTVIRVGPYQYGITFDGAASYAYAYSGVTLYRGRRINLDPRQSDTELPQTFLHEVLHALGNAYEVTAWDRHTTDSNQQVTDKIDLMASALLQWLRANPRAVQWLISEPEVQT